jgi:uncharacterized protein
MDIFQAVQSGDLASLTALLDQDPTISSARDKSGVSLLMMALYYRQRPAAELIQKTRARHGQPLDIFEAAACGDAGALANLLAKDAAAVNSYSTDGWTPLHLAAAFADKNAVELLLKSGAAPSARSKNGLANTPLNAAIALNPSADIVEALLQQGANVNSRQHGGHTPLHEAAAAGHVDLVKLLLAHGADVSITDDSGKTARQLALERGKREAAALLGR